MIYILRGNARNDQSLMNIQAHNVVEARNRTEAIKKFRKYHHDNGGFTIYNVDIIEPLPDDDNSNREEIKISSFLHEALISYYKTKKRSNDDPNNYEKLYHHEEAISFLDKLLEKEFNLG